MTQNGITLLFTYMRSRTRIDRTRFWFNFMNITSHICIFKKTYTSWTYADQVSQHCIHTMLIHDKENLLRLQYLSSTLNDIYGRQHCVISECASGIHLVQAQTRPLPRQLPVLDLMSALSKVFMTTVWISLNAFQSAMLTADGERSTVEPGLQTI